jgi:hypothetical protein
VRLIAALPETVPGGLLGLDFSGVQHVSASFLRESVVAFHDYVRAYIPETFPVIVNATNSIREELEIILRARNRAMPVAQEFGSDFRTGIIGSVDGPLQLTLELLRKRPSSAIDLADADEQVGRTGWNNRLSALAQMGLIVSDQTTKSRKYRFILDEASKD